VFRELKADFSPVISLQPEHMDSLSYFYFLKKKKKEVDMSRLLELMSVSKLGFPPSVHI